MKLLDNPASPYCRKVRALLIETGHASDVELVATGGHPTDPNLSAQAHNPLGKIPTLWRADGPALYDSRVICRFLDARFAGGLYPEAGLWEVLTLEATADGVMDAAVLMVYEGRSRAADKRDSAWVEGQWTKIEKALAVIETRWMSHLNGPVTIGQIAVGCALGYLDFRHGDREWRTTLPGLAEWFASFSQRASMRETSPPAS